MGLLDCDIATKEGMKQAGKEGLFTSVCPKLVESAARLLEEMG